LVKRLAHHQRQPAGGPVRCRADEFLARHADDLKRLTGEPVLPMICGSLLKARSQK
jgi:hypothetical protein